MIKHDVYHKRIRDLRRVKKTFSLECPICGKKIRPPPIVELNDIPEGQKQKTIEGLKLAHVRHAHTNYEIRLSGLTIENDEKLEELEQERTKILLEFKEKRVKIQKDFELRKIKVKEECNEEAQKQIMSMHAKT